MLDDPRLNVFDGKDFVAQFLKIYLRGVKPIKKLRELAETKNSIPHFRFLLAEVLSAKSPELAKAEMEKIAHDFPNHLYGISYQLLSANAELKAFPLSKPMPELGDIVKDRWLFHPSEVFLFENAVLTYLLNHGKGGDIQTRLSRLGSMTPNGLRPELLEAMASPGKPKAAAPAVKSNAEAEAPKKPEGKTPAKPAEKATTAKSEPKTAAKPVGKSANGSATKARPSARKPAPKASAKKPT